MGFRFVVLLFLAVSTPAQAQTIFLDCGAAPNPAACKDSRDQLRAENAAFARRDYQAARNRAFCLWTGCNGAIQIDKKSSCFVRKFIIQYMSSKVDDTDMDNLRMCINAGY